MLSDLPGMQTLVRLGLNDFQAAKMGLLDFGRHD